MAAGWTGAILGGAYAIRMVADSVSGLTWLRWASPLGWVEELRPMGDVRPVAVLPIIALTVVSTAAAVVSAGRRDLGGAAVDARSNRVDRPALLQSSDGLSVRLLVPAASGWVAGIALGGLLLGLIAKSAGDAIAESPGARATLARLGARGWGAQAYLGAAFLPVALLVSLVAASQVAAARAEEGEGRLEQLLVRPVSRGRWLGARIAIAISVISGAAVLAGITAWVGAASQNTGIGIDRLVSAGANVVAPALVVLGLGVCAIGLRPRIATTACYALVVWSFLVEILGSVLRANPWLLDTSLFHHLAAAPAVDPRWSGNLVLLTVAAGLITVGWFGFVRRDIVGG
jgi:ABC-2 type transport system permease protein